MNAHLIDDASDHASLVRSAFKVEAAARKQCQKQIECMYYIPSKQHHLNALLISK
jgi:hypothetical protein